MTQTDWLDEILGNLHMDGVEAGRGHPGRRHFNSIPNEVEHAKSQILAKLTQVELEGRIDEVNRYEKTAQTLSENAMFNYAEIRLAQLNRLKEQK